MGIVSFLLDGFIMPRQPEKLHKPSNPGVSAQFFQFLFPRDTRRAACSNPAGA